MTKLGSSFLSFPLRLLIRKKDDNPATNTAAHTPPIRNQGNVATPAIGVGVGVGVGVGIGVSVGVSAGTTVRVSVPVFPFLLAVISVLPPPTPLAKPEESMVATSVFELRHATLPVTSRVIPSEYLANAVNCCLSLTPIDPLPPATLSDTITGGCVGVGAGVMVGVGSGVGSGVVSGVGVGIATGM